MLALAAVQGKQEHNELTGAWVEIVNVAARFLRVRRILRLLVYLNIFTKLYIFYGNIYFTKHFNFIYFLNAWRTFIFFDFLKKTL